MATIIDKRPFTLERETKNTRRYLEEPPTGQPPAIGTLYIQKWILGNGTLGDPPPQRLAVTIETEE